ncbi:hypothetical protein [Actinoplanes sp. NPDC051859]|uniref:hypothetical protein n=1 Tax=Actinoplanes sp. NPDC051859 TaxID=3363909 RepID=UPI0037B57311
MTVNTANPSHPAHPDPGDSTASITVSVKQCCGILTGDECDCAAFAAEALVVFTRPIILPPAPDRRS